MRPFPPLLIVAVAACAPGTVNAPSLAPRATEAIDPRVPVPEPALPASPDRRLVDQLDSLVAQASAGDEGFRLLAERAAQLAEAAGPKESESWIVAQQALSAAIAARAPVARAVGDIDALGSAQVQQLGGIGAANLEAMKAAAARVAEIDEREAATIAQLQARLSR